MSNKTTICLILIATLGLAATPLTAQPAAPVDPSFTLSTSGPRALGMAGTFLAVADDVTAAAVNPAGLVQIEQRTVMGTLRYAKLDHEDATLLNIDDSVIPVDRTLPTERFEDELSGPAFAGYVHPLGNARIAIYYQRSVDHQTGSLFTTVHGAAPFLPFRVTTTETSDFRLTNEELGLAGALRLGRRVAIGATLRFTENHVRAEELFSQEIIVLDEAFSYVRTERRTGIDQAVTGTAGVLVNPDGRWSVGLAYHRGETYDSTHQLEVRGDVICIFDVAPPCTGVIFTEAAPFDIPDSYGVGLRLRPSTGLTVALDAKRVTYSDLDSRRHADVYRHEPIEDGTEASLGVEWLLPRDGVPITLRAGVRSEEDHDGLMDVDSDEVLFALGAGAKIGRGVQLDGAVLAGDRRSEAMLGLSYAF